ncbi:MAG: SPFH domain-containing protein [Candidatus Bathyarchaeota archaeon]|nr:SPFH domain-containing protein [Candidatus Bathyarchaeota archaeon]
MESSMINLVQIVYGVVFLIIFAAILASAIYVVKQWEKVAVIRLGRIIKVVETGLHLRIPLLDSIRRVDLRTETLDLMGQSAITKDNISTGIDAVVFMKIEDAEKLILQVTNYREAVSKYAQTSIRNVVGQYNLDDLLASREEIAKALKDDIDQLVKQWGIDIPKVGLQDISLPPDMKRAFAVQAEAERESRAIIVKASAELEASVKLKEAAMNLQDPSAMQLRILSTINDVSKDQSNTIILALPLETLKSAGVEGIAAMSAIKPKYQQG